MGGVRKLESGTGRGEAEGRRLAVPGQLASAERESADERTGERGEGREGRTRGLYGKGLKRTLIPKEGVKPVGEGSVGLLEEARLQPAAGSRQKGG